MKSTAPAFIARTADCTLLHAVISPAAFKRAAWENSNCAVFHESNRNIWQLHSLRRASPRAAPAWLFRANFGLKITASHRPGFAMIFMRGKHDMIVKLDRKG
jgi:hypothetical protein